MDGTEFTPKGFMLIAINSFRGVRKDAGKGEKIILFLLALSDFKRKLKIEEKDDDDDDD